MKKKHVLGFFESSLGLYELFYRLLLIETIRRADTDKSSEKHAGMERKTWNHAAL